MKTKVNHGPKAWEKKQNRNQACKLITKINWTPTPLAAPCAGFVTKNLVCILTFPQYCNNILRFMWLDKAFLFSKIQFFAYA